MGLGRLLWAIVFCLQLSGAAAAGEVHDAAARGDVERLRSLLAVKGAWRELDPQGSPVLHVAVAAGQVAAVQLLLRAGAEPMQRDASGRTAYQVALEIADAGTRAQMRFALLQGRAQAPGSAAAGPMPWTLEYAVARKQVGVVEMLLGMGVDPNTLSTQGTLPLSDAALLGDVKTMEALLRRGAKVDAENATGTKPIHDAALGGHVAAIRLLHRHGADVNARTRKERQTPLEIAQEMERQEAVAVLRELGAAESPR